MGIIDGQPVNAATTNPAFLDANLDDTALGKITLNNISDPTVSGPEVQNIQREHNSVAAWLGKPTNIPYSSAPTWTNNQVGSAGDSVTDRANNLTGRFSGSIGHSHSGADGEGPQIAGAFVANVPYRGYFIRGIDLVGVTGTSTDVSVEIDGASPSNSSTELGVVVNEPYNKVILRHSDGATQGEQIKTGDGDIIYGRLIESSGVWTLSYYYEDAGVETVYDFTSSENIAWYYQELFNPMVSTPVYDPGAFVISDNATADVVYATDLVAGKVLLANSAPPAIQSTSALGISTRVALQDHTHAGVHSLSIEGDLTQALGDVVIEAGPGIGITWDAGKIKIEVMSFKEPTVELRTITSDEALAKSLTLTSAPVFPAKTQVTIKSAGGQFYGDDFTVTGSTLSWLGLGLDGLIESGDKFTITYWA